MQLISLTKLFDFWVDSNYLNIHWEDKKQLVFSISNVGNFLLTQTHIAIPEDNYYLSIDLTDEQKNVCRQYQIEYIVFRIGQHFYYKSLQDDKIKIFRYLGEANIDNENTYLGLRTVYQHNHSILIIDKIIEKCKFLRINRASICDRETLGGVLPFYQLCINNNIECLIGITMNIMYKQLSQIDKKCVVNLYVQNNKGWDKLLLLFAQYDFNNHYIDYEDCILNKEGVDGLLLVCDVGDYELINRVCGNGNNVYQKICYNTKIENQFINRQSVISHDAFMLERDQYESLQLKINDAGNFTERVSKEQYFINSNKLKHFIVNNNSDIHINTIKTIYENSINNINNIFDSLDFQIDTHTIKIPIFKQTICENNTLYLQNKINDGWKQLSSGFDKGHTQYKERVHKEINIIKKGKLIDYFLILDDIIAWCHQQNIQVGAGRGSASGSLVCYLLGITQIDPIHYNLLFERFLNEGRLEGSMPDIDVDFPSEHREKVKNYIREKYGNENVCEITTYSQASFKTILQIICRFKKIPHFKLRKFLDSFFFISNLQHENYFSEFLYYLFSKPNEFTNLCDIVYHIYVLTGTIKNKGKHAAGLIITPSPAKSLMPCTIDNDKLLSEWEGEHLQNAGFLKEDILAIDLLDKFTIFNNLYKKEKGENFNFQSVPTNDDKTIQYFKNGWCQDIFNFSSSAIINFITRVSPDNIKELIDINALWRPGVLASGGHNKYVSAKRNKKIAHDPLLEEVTKDSYGQYIYQEQVMKACQIIGDFSLVEADDIRKAMGKLKKDLMHSYKKQFVSGGVNKGLTEERCVSIWNKLVTFAGYGFNKSHATSYTLMGYWWQYCKVYHPKLFWIAAFQYAKEEKLSYYITEMFHVSEINIKPPSVQFSHSTATFHENNLYLPLQRIVQVGPICENNILTQRREIGLEESIDNIIEHCKINKAQIVNLIFSGALDYIIPNMTDPTQRDSLLLYCLDNYQFMLDEKRDLSYFLSKQYSNCGIFSDYGMSKKLFSLTNVNSYKEKIGKEIKIMGIIQSENVNNKYNRPTLSLYSVDNLLFCILLRGDASSINTLYKKINRYIENAILFVCKFTFRGYKSEKGYVGEVQLTDNNDFLNEVNTGNTI